VGPLQTTILLVITAIGVVGFSAARSIRSTFDTASPAAIPVPAEPAAITVPAAAVTVVLAEPVPIR
jgi:hypothetical protein